MCLLIPLKKEHTRNGSTAEQIYQEYVAVAQDDIEVYKVLIEEDGVLISPYQRYIYEVGKRYNEKFTFADHATSHIGYNRVYDHLVLHGGLHSYASIDAATEDVLYDHGEVICRFTIPKGSLVFKEGDEVCSEAIVFEEVLVYAGN